MLTVLPIRYVADVAASRHFHAGLGLVFQPDVSVDVWAQLAADAGAVGIHDANVSQGRPPGTTELGFATDERLEDIAERLARSGYDYDLVDENFGRSIRVTDPDGVVIQIQEIDHVAVRSSAAATRRKPA
ncbi:VOC family protein [Streptomyces sp. NBC_01799]|uniref:VOC family protein n=1 Tax=Streptomyces sp. NBC_01800 TaxID=2975945 RepID=UPI002DDB2583|nr:VOC family protein [Streptomyces sp. NBC_01800]WSA72228.1 VOC family protein [Streptomyces sp. NBC_01800]WSA80749.1 VOC family protein [Streptomyces sp. NBC_01799]